MKNNMIVIHDTQYVVTKAYQEGARAFREGIPWNCNPRTPLTQPHDDWDYGHTNEAAGEHLRFGIDVIDAPKNGRTFEMDPAVPRDHRGEVCKAKPQKPGPAFTSKASLLEPHPEFGQGGTHRGVWQRKTVTSCWHGKLIKLKTVNTAIGTCCCDIIRVGDEFAVAYTVGNPKATLKQFADISGACKAP